MSEHANELTRRQAVAIAYNDGDSAPKVTATGRGLIADTIIARAREAGVYVHESRELVSLLMQLDLDERIPPQLYLVVAELLAWLYRIDRGNQSPPETATTIELLPEISQP